jgi:hypothetical protein
LGAPRWFVMLRPKSKSYSILNKMFIKKSVKLKKIRKNGAKSSYCWKALDEQDFMKIIS